MADTHWNVCVCKWMSNAHCIYTFIFHSCFLVFNKTDFHDYICNSLRICYLYINRVVSWTIDKLCMFTIQIWTAFPKNWRSFVFSFFLLRMALILVYCLSHLQIANWIFVIIHLLWALKYSVEWTWKCMKKKKMSHFHGFYEMALKWKSFIFGQIVCKKSIDTHHNHGLCYRKCGNFYDPFRWNYSTFTITVWTISITYRSITHYTLPLFQASFFSHLIVLLILQLYSPELQ